MTSSISEFVHRFIVYFFVFTILFSPFILSCGVTQHNLIAHKALSWFNPSDVVADEFGIFLSILQNNQDAFQAGAAFPDWGYACADDGDASEMAHWPPFTLTYADYFIHKCGNTPGNWTSNSNCDKLAAFVFGIVSHQVADVLWHNLAIVSSSQQGFIQAMANTDFDGDFGDAHSLADAGAEFIIAKEFDLSFIQREWYVPAADISTIYNILGKDIAVETLIECNLLLYAEVHAVKVGGALLYPYAAKQSSFLEDQQLNYWLGGMDDNAIWSLWCWYDYLMYWLTSDNLSDISTYPVCLAQQPLFGDCPKCNSIKEPYVSPEIRKLSNLLVNNNDSFKIENNNNGGYTFSANDNISSIIKEELKLSLNNNNNNNIEPFENINKNNNMVSSSCNDFINTIPTYYGSIDNSYAGWCFSSGDINNNGYNDLVIGAPGWGNYGSAQQGGIYYLYGNSTIEKTNNLTNIPPLIGENSHDRFGWASEIIDINKDGFNDLIVSSPGYLASELTYKGKLTIFFGNSNGIYNYSSSMSIVTLSNYTNLGDSFSKYDFDNDGYLDLIVTAPFAAGDSHSAQQNGKVFVILSNSNNFINGTNLNIENISIITLVGESSNNLFGKHIEIMNSDVNQPPLILIGAPYYMLSSTYEVGAIYSYNIDKLMNGHDQSSSLVFKITGEDLWDQTGFSFSVGELGSHSSVLALSTPGRKTGFGEEQFGATFFYDISSLKGTNSLYDIPNIIVLQGDEKYARFSYTCLYDKDNTSWWITQPKRSYNLETHEAGALFRWDSTSIPKTPRDPVGSANECWVSSIKNIRFGESIHIVDLDGNGKSDLIIGSPRYSNTLSGAFSILLN